MKAGVFYFTGHPWGRYFQKKPAEQGRMPAQWVNFRLAMTQDGSKKWD